VPRAVRRGFGADLGAAQPDSKPGAAAAGRAALRLDVVPGTGGARYPGPAGPDPGGGEEAVLESVI